MASVVREEDRLHGISITERRKINWSAIWAGIVTTLGVAILMLYLGSALGLSLFNPYSAAFHQTALTWSVLLWLAFTATIAPFFGAWVAGHWANLYDGEDALIHGAATWALSLVFATLAAVLLVGLAPPRQEALLSSLILPGTQPKVLAFDSLKDQQFTGFLITKANDYSANQPVSTSAEKEKAKSEDSKAAMEETAEGSQKPAKATAKPPVVANKDELVSYLTAQTNLDKKEAKDFLMQDSADIAKAQNDAYKRWEQAHRTELINARHQRTQAMEVSWSIFGFAVVALLAALGGSYFGWLQRYGTIDEELITEEPPQTGTTL